MKKKKYLNKLLRSFSPFERMMLPGWMLLPGNEELRRIAVIAYPSASIAIIGLAVYGILGLLRHDTFHAMADLSFAVVMTGILAYHRRTKRHDNSKALYIGLATYGAFCIFHFFNSGIFDRATYLWSYTFPLMIFPIAGSRRGAMAMVVFFVPIFLLLLIDPVMPFSTPYPRGFAFPFIPSILAVAGLSYMYERIRERNQQLLNQTNTALQKSNEKMEQKIQERTADLAKSEEKYRFLTERMSDIVWTADMNLVVTYVSPSIARMLGFSQEEYRGIPFREKVTPDSFNKAMVEYAAGIERENTPGISPDRSLQIELEFLHKDGSTVWMELLLNPVRDEGGKMVGIHGVSRDITDRKRKEELLKKQSDKLRELSVKLSETEESERRRISRELHDQAGQNLATLGLNLNILQSMLPEGSAGIVRKQLVESSALLEQTAEFIRDLMGDLRPPVMDDYGLPAAIRWYGKRFTARTGIEFTFQGQENLPRLKTQMEITFYRIFQEAMLNVWKHSQADNVDVSVDIRENRLRLTIVDNGAGFDLNKLMQAEQRNGWGLTTMAERAELIGGVLSIESLPGQGTRITVEAAL